MSGSRSVSPRLANATTALVASFAVALALALALSASATDDVSTAATATTTPAALAGNDLPPLLLTSEESRSRIATAARRAPDRQAAAIADGRTTADDYLAAVEREQTCVAAAVEAAGRELGIDVTVALDAPRFTQDRFGIEWGYSFDVAEADRAEVPDDATDRVHAIALDCSRSESLAVKQVWQLQLRSDPAYVEDAVGRFGACVRSHGVDVDVTVDNATATAVALPEHVLSECVPEYPSITTLLDAKSLAIAWES